MDDPIPTLPLERTVRKDCPDEDATLNGLIADVEALCTLRAKDDEDALTPSTVPLSIRVEVPSVEEVSHLVAKPNVPPVTPDAVTASVEVATQRVEVPVD